MIIDTLENLQRSEYKRLFISIALIASALTLAAYLLILMLRSEISRGYLFLSLSLIFYAIRIIGIDNPTSYLYPSFPPELLLKMEYYGMFLCIPAYLLFFQTLYPVSLNKRALNLFASIGILGSLYSTFAHPQNYTLLRDPYTLLVMGYMCYFFIGLSMMVIRRQPGSFLIGILGLFFALLVTNEVFYHLQMTKIRLTDWAYLIVAMTCISFLGHRMRSMLRQEKSNNIGLQQAIDQRTVELQAKIQQLDQSHIKAVNAANRKSELLAVISHEVRTPISALLGSIRLLSTASLTEREEQLRSNAEQSSESILDIVNEVLEVSRLEHLETTSKNCRFELRSWCQSIERLMEIPAKEKRLPFHFDISHLPDTPTWLQGDRQKLRQVLINLIHNAIKFTEKGQISVSVELHNTGTNAQLILIVADTGIGIPDSSQKAIFDAYNQATKNTSTASYTRNNQGIGLGLSITHKLVEVMQGKISLQSKIGQGSTFHIMIPVQYSDVPEEEQPDQESMPDSSLNVLVVDDDPANRLVAMELLTRDGHYCIETETGIEALDIAEKQNFSACLLDIRLPGMDGVKLCGALKESYKRRSLPTPLLVALTANQITDNQARYRAAGFDKVLAKPVNQKQLRQILKQAESRQVADVTVLTD